MSKKNITDIAIDNLAGFVKRGARTGYIPSIPTNIFNLDYAIHYGCLPGNEELGSAFKKYDPNRPLGFPMGRLVEIYGPEGCGKSYTAHRIVGSAQKMGLECAWIDAERSYSEDLALINGVDLDNLLISDLTNFENPDQLYYAEDILDNIVNLVKNDIKVVVLDSVANLVPKARMESSSEQQFFALTARLLSDNLGKVVQWAGAKGALVICINQLREKPGVSFGNPITTPGGKALKHAASLRIEIIKRTAVDSLIKIEDPRTKSGQRVIGRYSGLKIDKNRFARPLIDEDGKNIIIDLPVHYEPYVPNIEEVIFDAARQVQLIRVRKGVFTWVDSQETEHKIEGKDKFLIYLKEKNLVDILLKEVSNKFEEGNMPLPPELVKIGLEKD